MTAWLAQDYDVGRGHDMAFFHVVKNEASIGDQYVGTTGAPRDASDTRRLDGLANR